VFIDGNTVSVSAPGSTEPVPSIGNLYIYYHHRFPFAAYIHLTGHQRDSRFGADFSTSLGYLYVGEPFYRTGATSNEGVATRSLYPP
jgi:hypothetical protein